jgi:hypothetical protein
MSLDLKIPGDPAGILNLAEWLSPTLSRAVSDVDLELAYTWSDSQQYWTGESGDAFRDAAMQIRNRSSNAPSFMQDVAEVFRAYANRLIRGQEQFDEYLRLAGDAGLSIAGHVIMLPITSLQYCPADSAPQEDIDEYRKYEDKIASYNRISEYVGEWRGKLKEWLVQHMVPLTGRVAEFSDLEDLLGKLRDTNGFLMGAVLEFTNESAKKSIMEQRMAANTMQEAADQFDRQLRSGNPALRAAAEAADPNGIRVGLGRLNEDIVNVTSKAKLIPYANTVLTIVTSGVELANGGSPTSIAAGLGGTAVGVAVGGPLVAAVPVIAATPAGVVIGVGAIAAAAGVGAKYLWEAAVPLDWRETLDDAILGPPQVLRIGSTVVELGDTS